jgi:hypothetical protein
MFEIYTWIENFTDPNLQNKFKKFIYTVFIPIFLLLEYILYMYYWKNIVIREILTSDEIVGFLDKQEFSYDGNVIRKIDLLSENEFFDRIDSKDAKEIIKTEYVKTISDLFTNNIPINIEEYITLLVSVDLKIIKKDDESYRDRIYIITIQFCRQFFLDKAKKKFNLWLIFMIIACVLGTIGYYFLINLYNHT